MNPVRTVSLPTGERVPALGLGTWKMGESTRAAALEVAAIRHAIALGYRLFDTAEMYGEGGAETVLGKALAEALRAGEVRREELTIVSKVYPHNASRKGVPAACDRSRQRLGLDVIDVYLLHWRGGVPLAETVDAFEAEKARGAIREWGVSNFDVHDLVELEGLPAASSADGLLRCATNQVCYALDERGPDFGLRAWHQARQMPLMAYCPLGQGSLAGSAALAEIAAARGATAAQIALAWTLRDGDVIAIPKAVRHAHLAENLAALHLMLTEAELAAIDAAFPPPTRKTPLAMV
ncbi:aldo/keto reductase [Ideonella azotifigens]|uniref:Aldo/keto reductase n=2 Tax=Ideonella azotifigens TaxID=513160 RepID=A0ABN1JWQ4_9BURK|nr:aldo/keto reductase [Ideonella azotifigens]MCD2341217.1 aldo/keto reductase [Ideonella azotifigens]